MLWYDFSIQNVSKNIFYFTKIIFSQYLKSPFLGIFYKKLDFKKKKWYNAFVFIFLSFFMSHISELITSSSLMLLENILIIVLLSGFLLIKYIKKFLEKDISWATALKLTSIPALFFCIAFTLAMIPLIVVLLVAPDLFADHGLADTYAFLWPVGSWLLSIAVYFFSLKKKLMSNGVAADIAKTMAESVTKYAIALTILIMFALKFFLN